MRGIKIARTIKNMTQTELSNEMGVSLTTISAWETGKYNPSVEKLIELSKVLDTTIDKLVKTK